MRAASFMRLSLLVGSIGLVGVVGCKKQEPPPPPAAPAAPARPTPPPPPPPATPDASPADAPVAAAAPEPKLNPALLTPSKLAAKAPAKFKAKFVTSKGDFVIEVNRSWAPNGADRFYNLVKNGYFENLRFFRAIQGFMVQFGIHGNPEVNTIWRQAQIADDPVKESNKAGMVTFAMAGPNTRTTQLFINFVDNVNLDRMGFPPFGKVIAGMDVVNSLYTGYGEGAPGGAGPEQGRIQMEGNPYLMREFPQLDFIKEAKIVR